MRALCNGTALLTDHAKAQKFPQGWKVKCLTGAKPWISPARFRNGEAVAVKWVKTKPEAIRLMGDCVPQPKEGGPELG